MAEVEPSLFNEIKKNKFSSISKFSEEDVAAVWESVSRFVEKHMAGKKTSGEGSASNTGVPVSCNYTEPDRATGVNIPGLGSFTFSERNVDMRHGHQVVLQRPVFQLAEKFAQTHALNYTKHYVTGQIPILPLNFTAIASDLPYPREMVESCVKEVLQAVSRSLHVKRNVEFIFSGIGCLSIRDARVKMKFYREFVKSMDNTGELVNALRNRPDTTDSVFSEIITFRPNTGNTVVLPRINLSTEDKQKDEARNGRKPVATNVDDTLVMKTIEECKEEERLATPVAPVLTPRTATRCQSLALEAKQPVVDNPNEVPHRPLSSPHCLRLRQQSRQSRSRNGSPHASQGQVSPKAATSPNKKVIINSPETRCSHSNKAGQELCYLCHQRNRKNIPIYLTEESKRREQENDKCLTQYQHTKDLNAVLREQAKQLTNRKINQETAAFNIGVAEAIKEKKNARSLEFHRSYLFRNRPLTPPFSMQQAKYSKELQKQVDEKNRLTLKEKSDQDFLDRLEQVQLAEELAQQREQYLQEKKFDKEHYRGALNAQVHIDKHIIRRSLLNRSVLDRMRLPKPNIVKPFEKALVPRLPFARTVDRIKPVKFKSLPIPKAEPDSAEPIFGKHDATPEKLHEERERARKLYHEQLAMVADKKRAAILHDLTTQREESEMLEKVKNELRLDRAQHYYESLQARRALENSWAETMRRKQERDQQESLRIGSPGVLIQEQCDKYNRCEQCGRRPWNCGESNIWHESRYISGSRLIV